MKTKKWGSIKSIYSVSPDLQKICHFFTASFVSLATSFANKDGLRMPRQTRKTGTKTQWKTFFTLPSLPLPLRFRFPYNCHQLSQILCSLANNSHTICMHMTTWVCLSLRSYRLRLFGKHFAHNLHAHDHLCLCVRDGRYAPIGCASLANNSHTICMPITNPSAAGRSIGLFVFYKMSLREYAQRNCVYFAKTTKSEVFLCILPCLCGCLSPYANWARWI